MEQAIDPGEVDLIIGEALDDVDGDTLSEKVVAQVGTGRDYALAMSTLIQRASGSLEDHVTTAIDARIRSIVAQAREEEVGHDQVRLGDGEIYNIDDVEPVLLILSQMEHQDVQTLHDLVSDVRQTGDITEATSLTTCRTLNVGSFLEFDVSSSEPDRLRHIVKVIILHHVDASSPHSVTLSLD